MRLLLTRSAADAARTRETLEAMGHEVIVSPLIEMVATGAGFPRGVVDAVLATSAQAFASPLDGVAPEARRLMPLFLVGGRTVEAAKAAGFLGAATVAPHAAALADAMGDLAWRPRRLVYLAGRVRKPDLEEALAAVGQPLDVAEVYDARPVGELNAEASDAFARGALDGVLHYSRRSAELFIVAATSVDAGGVTHYCLSEDVATPLREAGWPAIRVSSHPDEAALLALVGTRSCG